jgi:hypothetical protein
MDPRSSRSGHERRNRKAVTASRLKGRWVHLVPISPPDIQTLYAIATNPTLAYQWRFRGAVPTLEAFVQHLNDRVHA